jgi:hypothetical protein
MPKRSAQNVFSSGITTLPPSASSPKIRSASAALSIWTESVNPFGSSYWSGATSAPIRS